MENWKPINGYEGLYEISNKNRVKSLERKIWSVRNNSFSVIKERILKDEKGDVSLCKNKVKKTFDVFTLKKIHHDGFNPKGDRKECIIKDLVVSRRKMVQDVKLKIKNKTSKYTGVSYHKRANKWRAMIMIDKIDVHLGVFYLEEDARDIYEKAVKYEYLYKDVPKLFREIVKSLK